MEADIGGIIMLLGVGMFLGVLLSFGIFFIGLSVESTEEQVSIQEDEMEIIGTYVTDFMYLHKMHDNKDNVTCWIDRRDQGGGISCIPDHMLSP